MLSRRAVATLGTVLCLWGCSSEGDEDPDDAVDLTVALPAPEFGFQIVTEPRIVGPGEEAYTCSVVQSLPGNDGDELVWVNELDVKSSEGSHHLTTFMGSKWSFADYFTGPGISETLLGAYIGTYDCDELGDLMEDAIPFLPSQRTHQQLTFPDGVAMPWFLPSLLVVEHHFINTTDAPVKINGVINFERIEEPDVTDVIGLLWASEWNMEIPPQSNVITTATCAAPFDMNVALMSTHTHQRGQCATINKFHGESNTVEPDPFFVNKDWERPPILHFQPDQMTFAEGDGFHYACHYYNETDTTVVSGATANDEMCMAVAGVYPTKVTVDEIKTIAEERKLSSALEMLDKIILDCAPLEVDPQTPWPMDEPVPGPPIDTCGDYQQTDSNTLP